MRSVKRASRPSSSGLRAAARGPRTRLGAQTGAALSDGRSTSCTEDASVKKTNHASLTESGHATRFGPHWPGQRCLAKTRAGGACQNPAIKGRSRCKLHGGRSTGPKTPEGKARVAAAHTTHGRRSAAHVAKVRYINAEIRRITYELKRDGFIP